ncbi:hypothetical protein XAUB_25800 [Xanthomonas citri pv. aurantifolii str. ICPB 11122]|nr:hypothetical protein XAUB_25800 [Xanthomonas citri pv. aurantifolii str. ICPB 11122]EFF46905.1 hypothetical protein XAUC_27300 [Xanthomonas citri pv. aurantifolii str. ICPB 10535]
MERCLAALRGLPDVSHAMPRGGPIQKAGDACACRLLGSLPIGRAFSADPPARNRVRSVQALTLGDVARGTTQLTLHGSGSLTLTLLGRLFIELALAGFGQHAGLFAGALETAERKFEGLVLADFNAGHVFSRNGISVREPRAGASGLA